MGYLFEGEGGAAEVVEEWGESGEGCGEGVEGEDVAE